MKEKRTLGERCTEGWNHHKRRIIIVGGVVVAIVGGHLVVKYWDRILGLFMTMADVQAIPEIVEVTGDKEDEPLLELIKATREVEVSPHILRLAPGKQASEAAKAFAAECGFVLSEGQTARHGCVRTIVA